MGSNRPPLGIAPAFIANDPRIVEIQRAINRYMDERLPVPENWLNEYNRLIQINKQSQS